MLPRLLRRAGVQVSAQRARSYLQAIAEIGLDHADDVRDASRASLVSRQTDLAPFDVTFDLFWSLLGGASLPTVVPGPRSPDAKADQIEVPLGQVPARMRPLVQRAVRVVASPVELLRGIDFSAMTTAERAAAARFLERLRWSPGERPSRRFRAARYGPGFDSRATLRRMLSTRGEPVVLFTDGWERGDPRRLELEAARLQRAAYRLIWIDPLSGTRDYSPEARGARALTGHVDDHLAANTLDGLARIAELLGHVGRGRPVRRAEKAA